MFEMILSHHVSSGSKAPTTRVCTTCISSRSQKWLLFGTAWFLFYSSTPCGAVDQINRNEKNDAGALFPVKRKLMREHRQSKTREHESALAISGHRAKGSRWSKRSQHEHSRHSNNDYVSATQAQSVDADNHDRKENDQNDDMFLWKDETFITDETPSTVYSKRTLEQGFTSWASNAGFKQSETIETYLIRENMGNNGSPHSCRGCSPR